MQFSQYNSLVLSVFLALIHACMETILQIKPDECWSLKEAES